MPITNLGRTSSGSILIDRSVEAAEWRHIPTYTSAEGGPAQSISVKDFLDGDVTTVATQGNFESAVFATSGTNLDLTITGTPRAAVMDGEQLADTITLRAQGASVGGVAPVACRSNMDCSNLFSAYRKGFLERFEPNKRE